MIWALLVFLGVPLWLCALGIFALLFRNRSLRTRRGDLPVRVLRPGKSRWTRGHALWISNVLAWRGSPAAWSESLEEIVEVRLDRVTPEEQKRLHRLGEGPAVAALTTADGAVVRVATTADRSSALLGPFGRDAGSGRHSP